MLAIQTYLFKIGTKIPFTQWPDLVQTYLRQQGPESYLTEVFTVLETVAGESLAALDAHYPPTPHWYMPKT